MDRKSFFTLLAAALAALSCGGEADIRTETVYPEYTVSSVECVSVSADGSMTAGYCYIDGVKSFLDFSISYRIEPSSAAETLADSTDRLSLECVRIATRSGSDAVKVPIRSASASEGVLTVVPDDSFLQTDATDFAVRLLVSDGGTDISSPYAALKIPVAEGNVPMAKLSHATSSTLSFTWSESDFSDAAADIAQEYRFSLYRDSALTDLEVSWKSAASDAIWSSLTPDFLFSGLEPDTDYWFCVTDLRNDVKSLVKAHTLAWENVAVGAAGSAKVGDVILAEDFRDLVWGGDLSRKAAGYSATGRANAATMEHARGENPVGEGAGWYLGASSVEMGLFNTLALSVPSTSLKDWANYQEGTAYKSGVCARPGYLKLGANSYVGRIVTPALSSLSGEATVRIEFKAARYASDLLTGIIGTFDDAVVTDGFITSGSPVEKVEFALASDGSWNDYRFELSGIKPTTRIFIGPVRRDGSEAGKTQHRHYLDDLRITCLWY